MSDNTVCARPVHKACRCVRPPGHHGPCNCSFPDGVPPWRGRCMSCGEIPEEGFAVVDREGGYWCEGCYQS